MTKLLFLLFLLPGIAQASVIVNPTQISASTLPSGSTNYIWNSNTLQSGATFYVSSGTVNGNFYDLISSTSQACFIGTTTQNGFFNAVGVKPADVTNSNGQSSAVVGSFYITGAAGGDSTQVTSSSRSGGKGGGLVVLTGTGGLPTAGTGTRNGGAGGDVTITGAPGATITGALGGNTYTGGDGGGVSIVGGVGGSATGGIVTQSGGGGGGVAFTAGNGGANGSGSTATNRTGRIGGGASFTSGDGGGTIALGTLAGGGGGGFTFQGGRGGVGSTTSGTGANLSFTSGQGGSEVEGGGTIATAGGSGQIAFSVGQGGNGVQGGDAGDWRFVGGSGLGRGGVSTTGTGGAGADHLFAGGYGGRTTAGTGDGGRGGYFEYMGGDGATSFGGLPGNGGSFYIRGGYRGGSGAQNGNIYLGTSSTGTFVGKVGIGLSTSTVPGGYVHALSQDPTVPTTVFQSTTSQTARITEWWDVNGTTLAYVDASGNPFFSSGTVTNLTATASTFTHVSVSSYVSVPDEAYGASWNGKTEVPTKNALFDKLDTFGFTVSTYSASGAYSLTTTTNTLAVGPSSSTITLTSAGTYRLDARVNVLYNGATFAANQFITFNLYRQNNTPGVVANSQSQVETAILATPLTATFGDFVLPPIIYTTTNSDDVLSFHGSITATPGAGSVQATEASVLATRIY